MSHRDLRSGMSRAQATALLGLPGDADAEQVRRAWRAWARLAHPDHGGDREFFDRLRLARDVLLDTDDSGSVRPEARTGPEPDAPAARPAWSQVLRRPRPAELVFLGLLAVVSVALGAIVGVVGEGDDLLTLAVAVSPAAVAAAGWAHIVVSRILTHGADVGHRITALTVAWVPITAAQLLLAGILGVSLVPVLPVLVLPFVVVVAAVNPGAGFAPRANRRG